MFPKPRGGVPGGPATSLRFTNCSEDELADTYAAQFAAAWEAGWSDPEMAEYDAYELNRLDQ